MNAHGHTYGTTTDIYGGVTVAYGFNHAHINRSGATEVLNSLKLPWSFPDQHGSSRTTTNHDGLVDGATTVLSRITTVHHDSSNRSEPWSEPWMCKRALTQTLANEFHMCHMLENRWE